MISAKLQHSHIKHAAETNTPLILNLNVMDCSILKLIIIKGANGNVYGAK
jgi:hypothetical protein